MGCNCEENEENEEVKEEKIQIEVLENDDLPDDALGRHKIFTRFMVLSITYVFLYSFIAPLPIAYAELSSYIMIFALMVITFGLNSLKLIGGLIDKWKRK